MKTITLTGAAVIASALVLGACSATPPSAPAAPTPAVPPAPPMVDTSGAAVKGFTWATRSQGYGMCPVAAGESALLIQSRESLARLNLRLGAAPAEFTQWPIDYAKETLLVIALGERPSGGYGLELLRENYDATQSVLNFYVREMRPAKDVAQMQVMTSPCVVVKLNKSTAKAVAVFRENAEKPMARLPIN